MGVLPDERRQTSPEKWWVISYGRIGYAAKATIYIVVGLLALGTSIGVARLPPNTEGALAAILQRPYGVALLGLLTFGLFGYALWQLVAAIVDGEQDGSDTKGRLARVGKVWGALIYTLLGLEGAQVLVRGLAGGEQTEAWTATILQLPMGRWIVMLVGAGVIAYGLYQLYAVYSPPVRWHRDVACLGRRACLAALTVGRFGLLARCVLFTLVGVRLVQAALQSNARAAAGLGKPSSCWGSEPWDL